MKPCQHEGCNGWAWAQAYCDHHYQKLKRLGIIKPKRILNDPVRRFYSKIEVNPVTLCWEWQGTVHPTGYGMLGIGGRAQQVKAHRFSYELFFGTIPPGQRVLHYCDVRTCANPAHLWLGTDLDNMQDCSKKGRTGGQRGTSVPKLTDAMVMNIRVMYARGAHSCRQLAAIYTVTEETIRKIVKAGMHLAA